jgi:hypothetical protein
MNTSTTPFPAPAPALKLARRSVPLPEPDPVSSSVNLNERMQLDADLAELREREANLREYEARLRAWQDQLDADVLLPRAAPLRTLSNSNASTNVELQAAWEKFHRAHALLEAEQRQMRIDRVVTDENASALQRREAELAAREAKVAEWEQQMAIAAAATQAQAEAADPKKNSTMQRLTQAPFMAAKAVFSR